MKYWMKHMQQRLNPVKSAVRLYWSICHEGMIGEDCLYLSCTLEFHVGCQRSCSMQALLVYRRFVCLFGTFDHLKFNCHDNSILMCPFEYYKYFPLSDWHEQQDSWIWEAKQKSQRKCLQYWGILARVLYINEHSYHKNNFHITSNYPSAGKSALVFRKGPIR